MTVVYGADYSAREFSPQELNAYTQYSLKFLMRYIGYPSNPKCISHYPGAFQAHEAAGRIVLLAIENQVYDPRGGFLAGVAMANLALADARSIGYPENRPIFFCSDAWLANNGITVATAMAYLDGAASVLGAARVGAYGFRDFVVPARQGKHARYIWLCGAAPTDAEVAAGICDIYQSNQGFINPGSPPMESDLNWAYSDPARMNSDHAITTTTTKDDDMGNWFVISQGGNETGSGLLLENGAFLGLPLPASVRAAQSYCNLNDGASDADAQGRWNDLVTRFSNEAKQLAPTITVVINGQAQQAQLNPSSGHYELSLVQDTPPASGSTS